MEFKCLNFVIFQPWTISIFLSLPKVAVEALRYLGFRGRFIDGFCNSAIETHIPKGSRKSIITFIDEFYNLTVETHLSKGSYCTTITFVNEFCNLTVETHLLKDPRCTTITFMH